MKKYLLAISLFAGSAMMVASAQMQPEQEGQQSKLRVSSKQEKKTDKEVEHPDMPALQRMQEERIYTITDPRASFPAEYGAVSDWLSANIKWPADVTEDIEGAVIVRFCVEKDGKLTKLEVTKSLSKAFDAEALRVVSQMPAWIPGQMQGAPVRSFVTLPVEFVTPKAPAKK